jgi:hypothetical protein
MARRPFGGADGVENVETSTAETIVKIYAVLVWFGALFAVIFGVAVLTWGSFMSSVGMMNGFAAGGLAGVVGIIISLLFFALAILYFIAGLGLWKHRNWARILTLVLAVLSLFSFPIGTIIGALGIWLFGFEKAVISLFIAPTLAAAAVAAAPALAPVTPKEAPAAAPLKQAAKPAKPAAKPAPKAKPKKK